MATIAPTRRRNDPLEAVEALYGDVEGLAVAMFEVCPAFLEEGGEAGLAEAAKALNLPVEAVGAAVSSPEFNKTLDRLAAYGEYNFGKRRVAMRNLAHIATTLSKHVMSRSGNRVAVDRDADEMIKADSHLRKLQGQPLDEPRRDLGVGIQIVFGGAEPQETVEVHMGHEHGEEEHGEGQRKVYRGNRRGALPPEGARRFYRDGSEAPNRPGHVRPEFDFDGEETAEPRGVGSVTAAAEDAARDVPGGEPER